MTQTRFETEFAAAAPAPAEAPPSPAELRYAALLQASACISGADLRLRDGSCAGTDEALALLREAADQLNAALRK
jgi:hypothetical protein